MFLEHLHALLGAINSEQGFGFTRYGDGERAILQNADISTVGTNRHWCYRPSQDICDVRLSEDLGAALDHDDENWIVGISDPCCNERDYLYYSGRLSEQRLRRRTTYANLFSNGNWKHLCSSLVVTLMEAGRTVVLVSNWDKDFASAQRALAGLDVIVEPACSARYARPIANRQGPGFYHGGCTLWYCENRAMIRNHYASFAQTFSNAIVLVSLGPVANILIHVMYAANPQNTYIDMGHALDGILYNDPSRGYMAGEPARMCLDMPAGRDFELQPLTDGASR